MATVDKMTIGPASQQPAGGALEAPTVDQATLLRDVLLLVAEPLGEVEQILHAELRDEAPFVGELLEYVAALGGKRMRPCLVLLTALATGEIREQHKTLAAVIEMIHTATLVHDDILDGATTRRHQTTVNSRWGNQAAVLLGDYLFTHAFFLASTIGAEACHVIGKSTNRVCAGEMKQVGQRGNIDLTEEQYFQIIRGKTAELCACCCELGAHYAGADADVVEQLKQFGMEVGTAFQIADDILDLGGDEEKTGKSLGTDLVNQKMTLPVIHALSQLDERQSTDLKARITVAPEDQATIVAVSQALVEAGSVEYARRKASDLIEAAVHRITRLPDSPAKTALRSMAYFVLTRKN